MKEKRNTECKILKFTSIGYNNSIWIVLISVFLIWTNKR